MITVPAIGKQATATPPGEGGVTFLATVLIISPLLQWLYLTALSHFTVLEPPFTTSRGVVLAMQLFFAPGNVVAVVLGVGLMRRSEWTRRIARVLFLMAAAVTALQLGVQVAAWRFDANALLAGTTLVFSALYFWHFGRPYVKQQFQARREPARAKQTAADAVATPVTYSGGLIVCACVESFLGLAAVALLVHLHGVFGAGPLLDVGAGPGVADADELVKTFVFVCLALLLSPHVLTTLASIGILLGRATTSLARRYSLVACWSVVGCLLLTAWLVGRSGLAFDARSARMLVAFCVFSLAWHLCFLYALARARPPVDAVRSDATR